MVDGLYRFVSRIGIQAWALIVLGTLAVLSRIFVLSQPYHHDEHVWALAASPSSDLVGAIPHPFFVKSLYALWGTVVSFETLRFVPAIFSIVLLTILYFYVKYLFNSRVATVVVGVYTLQFYALFASTQIDIDGVFLPLSALVTFFGYQLLTENGGTKKIKIGIALFVCGILLGVISKLSFVLVPAAILIDYLIKNPTIVRVLFRPIYWGAALFLAVVTASAVWAYWDSILFLRYIENFNPLQSRDIGQLIFQTTKVLIYTSPLVFLGALISWRYWRSLSVWFVFFLLNILFYYIIFDFSHRTFDRYLMFTILPLTLFAGVAYAKLFEQVGKSKHIVALAAFAASLLAIVTHVLFSRSHDVIPLIPKSGFVDAITRGDFSILVPLSGGSGPLGFYLPADAIIFLWAAAALCVMWFFLSKSKVIPLSLLIAVSLVYNVFVYMEYAGGQYYGSAPTVALSLIENLEQHTDIDSLITYNDIGAYELRTAGLYAGRFYPHNEFVDKNVEKLAAFNGYYMVVQMPLLNPDSLYAQYFSQCRVVEMVNDKLIDGRILDCRGVDIRSLYSGR